MIRDVDIEGLEPSTRYLIGVVAFSENTRGQFGPVIEVTTLSNQNLQPTNLTLDLVNATVGRLLWSLANSSDSRNILFFEIQKRRDQSSKTETLDFSNSSQYLLRLEDGYPVYIRVVAHTTWEERVPSPWIYLEEQFAGPPGNVRDFSVQMVDDQANLTWSRPESPGPAGKENVPTGYEINFGPADNRIPLQTITVSDKRMEFVIQNLGNIIVVCV